MQTKTVKVLLNSLIGVQVLTLGALVAFSVTYHEPSQQHQSTDTPKPSIFKKQITEASPKNIANHKQLVESDSNKLMALLWSWSNSSDYNANKKASAKLVGNDNVSKLFAFDKDVSGNSYIDTAKLSSQLISSSVWVASPAEYGKSVINMDITAVYHAQFNADNYTSWNGDGVPDTGYYHATYDVNKKQFTSIKFVGRLDQNV